MTPKELYPPLLIIPEKDPTFLLVRTLGEKVERETPRRQRERKVGDSHGVYLISSGGPQGDRPLPPNSDTLRTQAGLLAGRQLCTMTSFSDYYDLNTEKTKETKEVCFGNLTFSFKKVMAQVFPQLFVPLGPGHVREGTRDSGCQD